MKLYKTYSFNKRASQYSLSIKVDGDTKYITFIAIGFGSAYAKGVPQFATADEAVQEGIENSKAFADGKIKLVSEVEVAPKGKAKGAPKKVVKPPKPPAKTEEPEDEDLGEDGLEDSDGEGSGDSDGEDGVKEEETENAHDPVVYDEVDKFRDAQRILTSPPYNVPKTSTEIRSKEAIHVKAAELGISFPNLI